jgi:hypothetical protein
MALLKTIRAKMTGFRNKQCLPHSLHSMMSDFCNLIQGKHRSNQEHCDEFNSMIDAAEASGATIGAHPGGASEISNTMARDANNPSKAQPNDTSRSLFCLALTRSGAAPSSKKSRMNSFETKDSFQVPAPILQRWLRHVTICVTARKTQRI